MTLPLLRMDATTGLPVRRPADDRAGQPLFVRAVSAAGRVVDGLLFVVSPGRAARRAYERQMFLAARGFDAADSSRLTQHRRNQTRDADSELNGKLGKLRNFAREEVRNNPIARNMKRTHGVNVVGDADVGQGITIDPAVRLPGSDEPDEAVNRALKRAWEYYRDRLEYRGRLGFADLLSVADGELVESGEVLAQLHSRPASGSDLPFSVEMLEADRLPMNADTVLGSTGVAYGVVVMTGADGRPQLDANGKPVEHYIKHGIEYDGNWQPVAYHLLEQHPGNDQILRPTLTTHRVAAGEVLHYFVAERSEQSRGVSHYIAALPMLADLRDLVSWELIAAKVQAIYGAHFSGAGPNNLAYTSPSTPKDSLGNEVSQLQPGTVTYGSEKVEFYQGARPGGTFLPFFQSLVRLCGAGFGIGYSSVAKDYSQGAYSALRQEDNEDERAYRRAQGLHARHFCRPVWARFVRACALKGIIDAREYARDPARFHRCEINCPGRKHINPLQEMTAEAVAVANGFKTLDEVINVSGMEPTDRLKSLAAYKAQAESSGLSLGWAVGKPKPGINNPVAANVAAQSPDAEPVEDLQPEVANV